MTDLSGARLGSSCSFFRACDRAVFHTVHQIGVDAVELIWRPDNLSEVLNDPYCATKIRETAAEEGVELWSVHLPFSEELDISSENREQREHILKINRHIIQVGAEAGVKAIVLHPSSEPITDKERPRRLELSRDAIVSLNGLCRELGLTLAVENLPRTCLCNRSSEMVELLRGTGASVCFDFNHSLYEDNAAFLASLIDSDLTVATVHISDYDLVNERHRLPGDGINDWKRLLGMLSAADYCGPLMYEIARKPFERDEIIPVQLAENMRLLRAGMI